VLSFIGLVVTLSIAAVGCRSKDAPAPAASATLAEAPAPATLLAELSLGNPKETWRRLRLLGGTAAQALPSSLPVLLATSLSFPPTVAGSLDESLPMVGAALSREGASEPDLVLGMHVTSGAELVASLTLGDGAKFRRVELAPRLVRLVAAPGAQEFNGALGVSGNYLLVATRVEALKDAGRFVAEGVAKRAVSEPGLSLRTTERVLGGSLSRMLREGWQARRAALVAGAEQQRKAKGRAPDFADPEAVLAGVDNTVEAFLGVLESSRQLELSLVPEADRLRVELSLLPGADGAAGLLASELVTGPIAPLWQLPRGTRAALLLRGDEQPKPGAAGLAESVTRLFGARLTVEQASQLSQAFEALAQSHRGATVVGLLGAPDPALLIRCEVTDPVAFSNAVAGLLRLVELGPVSSWLASTAGKPSLELGKSKSANMGQAHLRFKRQREGAEVLPPSLNVTWEAKDGVGYVVVSARTASGLAPFNEPVRLGASAWLQNSQPQLAAQAALGLYLDTRLLAPGGPDEAPMLLALGKRDGRIVLGADLAPAALHSVSRLFALDR
jgi:hypothetical protein